MRGAGAELVHALKYRGMKRVAPFLGARMVEALPRAAAEGADAIVPVPLHRLRLRLRGFNQSLLLATEVSRAVGVPAVEGLLVRIRATAPQAGLQRAGRASNVEGAFRVALPEVVKGRSILLIDDVATTGATLRACAQALLRAGAARVTSLVAAVS